MAKYEDSVFLNVPFDRKYSRISDALIFAVQDCGFVARSALEVEDSGEARVVKILDIIEQSKYGIHDISRAAIRAVRDWLSSHRKEVLIPGGGPIFERFEHFRAQLPVQARDAKLDHRELTFGDYTRLVVGWLSDTPW